MRSIQSKKYKMGTQVINKTSLLCFVLNGGIHTLAYFHKELRKQIHADDFKEKEVLNIKKIKKDSHKMKSFSQMITNKNKCVQINS